MEKNGKKKKPLRLFSEHDLRPTNLDAIMGVAACIEGRIVPRRLVARIKDFVEAADWESRVEKSPHIAGRLWAILKVCEARLAGVKSFDALAEQVSTGELSGEANLCMTAAWDLIYGDEPKVNTAEVARIDAWISDRLQYSFHNHRAADLAAMADDLTRGAFVELSEFNERIAGFIREYSREVQEAALAQADRRFDFRTEGESTVNAVDAAREEIAAPSNVIRTSVRKLNEMVGPGGFQAGRVYVFLGVTGGWKSGMLLQVTMDAAGVNDEIRTKDPTKRPCVLYVSQENSRDETVERVQAFLRGADAGDGLVGEDPARLASDLQAWCSSAVISFQFRSNRALKVADLDAMCEELEGEGLEPVMIVHDYIKRIRSNEGYEEARFEYGEVVNDLQSIAKERGVAIVTASQLNREAFRVVEAAAGKKGDVAKALGMSHVGESAQILENCDGAFAIQRERLPDGRSFLGVKKLKLRGRDTPVSYFAHPFESPMRLAADVHLEKSLSLESVGSGLAGFDPDDPASPPSGQAAKKAAFAFRRAGVPQASHSSGSSPEDSAEELPPWA